MSKTSADIYKTTQIFYIAEFREEQAWLSFMHKEGWKLLTTNGYRYTFERCAGEDWIYQLDFKQENITEADYIQMYEDYGWEFVLRFRHWYYFRKKKTDGAPEDMSIFSDNESLIDMCRSIIKHHAALIAGILGGFLGICAILLLFMPQSASIRGAFAGALTGSVFAAGFIGNQFQRLKRIMQNLESPIP